VSDVAREQAATPEDQALVERHRRLLMGLYQTIKVSQFHAFTNAAMQEPLSHFIAAIEETIRQDGSATISENEGHIFVNGRRFSVSGAGFQTVAEILHMFERRRVGGLRFERRLDKQGVKMFLDAFAAIPPETPDAPSFLRAWLNDHGGADLGVVALKPRTGSDVKTVSVSLATRARLLYAKLLVLLRELLGPSADDAATENFLMSRLKRAIQEVVSTSEQAPLVYLGLINVKNYDDYVVNHSANVAVLAILLARRLGLDRREICELAVAAALHDSGKTRLPVELLAKTGDFSPEDRAKMGRHPIEGVLATLRRARKLDRSTMARLITIFEHNAASNGYPERRAPRQLHLMSRIVAVVDAYDALTTARPYRRAFLPDEALGEIRRGVGTRFDAAVVKSFTALLGVYPHGTLVVLSGGERGLVLHNDLSDVSKPRPIVKVLVEPDGRRTERILDLGERDEDGKFLATIVGTDDPARYGIAVAAHTVP
jgi:HD-GYP domain-containing protein (c-di-GMP phosphodiesterase class II)